MSSIAEYLNRMLGRAPAKRDKRQGSVIYDALASVAIELAQQEVNKEIYRSQMLLSSAVGKELDDLAANWSIKRKQATAAIRIGEYTDTSGAPLNPPLNSRFGVPAINGGATFLSTQDYEIGQSLLTCETPGVVGNSYLGAILPLRTVNGLGAAEIIGTYKPGEDTESDDGLRQRVYERLNQKSFAGNVAAYKEIVGDIDGVGGVKVFTATALAAAGVDVNNLDNENVRLSVVDPDHNPISGDFELIIQNIIDPVPHNGEGLGVAPIGHRVEITTPNAAEINIEAEIVLDAGYTISQVQTSVEESISAYINSLKLAWADSDALTVYASRINAAVVFVPGVLNVATLTINGSAGDVNLPQTAATQLIPTLGSVVLSDA